LIDIINMTGEIHFEDRLLAKFTLM